jgi:hypothetical protein
MPEHHDVGAFGKVLAGGECTAERRAHSKHGEGVRGHARCGDAFRLPVASQVDLPLPPGRDFLQRPRATPVVHDLARCHPRLVERGPFAPDHDRASGLGPWQRAQQHGVDHAENRRVRADAECERDDRHGRETGVAREQPRTKAQILEEGLEGHGAGLDGVALAIVAALQILLRH